MMKNEKHVEPVVWTTLTSWLVWPICGAVRSHSACLSIRSTLCYCPVTVSGQSTHFPALSEGEGAIRIQKWIVFYFLKKHLFVWFCQVFVVA